MNSPDETTEAHEAPQAPNPTPPGGLESATLADDSRTVADASGITAAKPAAADIRDHELIRRIGQGSYGEVWLARNVMGTYRAVKIVYRAAFEHARPFEREFNGIQKFEPLSRSHDGFVDILQIGRADEYFYYVMELADDVSAGQQVDPNRYEPKTLRSEVQNVAGEKKALPFEQCVELGLSLSQALGKMHEHGLIHRDIKPSNIIFVNGIPKLADIGLVAEQSEAKSFVGTEGFIPPEGPGTPQADIYSLGKVLYEIATGKDRHEFPALPTLLGDSATDTHLLELNTVFLKACQGDLKQRYQTCEQMRDDLLLLQSGKSVARSQALQKRLAWLTRIGLVLVGLVLLVTAAFLYAQYQASLQTRLRTDAEKQKLMAERNLYAADMLFAAQSLEENNHGRAVRLLAKYIPSAPGFAGDLRGWEWRVLWNRARSDELFTLGQHSNGVTALVLASDGKTLFSASKDHTVGIWDIEKRQRLATLMHSDQAHQMAISSDARLLASADDTAVLRVWDVISRQPRFSLTNSSRVGFIRFTRDDGSLIFRDARGVHLMDLATRNRTQLISLASPDDPSFLEGAAFSHDGSLFACDPGDFSIRFLDIGRRVELARLPTEDLGWPHALAFSPDGNSFVAGGERGIAVWDVASRQLVKRLPWKTGWISSLAFSPDGSVLASTSSDQTIALWNTRTWETDAILRGHDFEVWQVLFTPDGSRLITGAKDKTIRLWDAHSRGRADERKLPQNASRAALSSDGSSLLVTTKESEMFVVDLESSRQSASIRAPGSSSSRDIAVAPGGQLVAFNHENALEVLDSGNPTIPKLRLNEGPPASTFFRNVVAFSPSGQGLLYGTGSDAVRLAGLVDSSTQTLIDPWGKRLFSVGFSSDERRVVAGYADGWIQWLDITTGRRDRIQTGHADQVIAAAFSPDGQVLATASFDPAVKLWSLESGTCLVELTGTLIGFQCLAFSPDGSRLAAGGTEGQIIVWDVVQSPPLQVASWMGHRVAGQNFPVYQLAFRPDGSLISLARDAARIWQAPALERFRTGHARSQP